MNQEEKDAFDQLTDQFTEDNEALDNSGFGDSTITSDIATILDGTAAVANAGYALVADGVSLLIPPALPAFESFYQAYSFIPNGISTFALVLWVIDGANTGENSIDLSFSDSDISVSISASQDTVVAVTTNLMGWFFLREYHAATLVDAVVFAYDLTRTSGGPRVNILPRIPTVFTPSISYNSNTGWNLSLTLKGREK